MPRPALPPYPADLDDPWHLVSTRAPAWVLDVATARARRQGCEIWVVLTDWLMRAGRLPHPPPQPAAVRRRYAERFDADGFWHSDDEPKDQLELLAAPSSSRPPAVKAKRTSRARARSRKRPAA
jgi:hypothetical protein